MGWVIAHNVKRRILHADAVARFGILKADALFYAEFGEGPYTEEQRVLIEEDVFFGDDVNWERFEEQQGKATKKESEDEYT